MLLFKSNIAIILSKTQTFFFKQNNNVLSFFFLENLALNKTVTVSQRYNNKDFDPSNAVDGDNSPDLLKCSLTASGQKEAWLTVDVGEVKNFAAISFLHGGCKFHMKIWLSDLAKAYQEKYHNFFFTFLLS